MYRFLLLLLGVVDLSKCHNVPMPYSQNPSLLLDNNGEDHDGEDWTRSEEIYANASEDTSGNQVPNVRKRSNADSLTRRSSLDKNFMRFGRSGFFPGERCCKQKDLVGFTGSWTDADPIMVIGRADSGFMKPGHSSDDASRRYGRPSRFDNFMQFRKKDKDNFMRFGRGEKDNFMRFGRESKDNFMRFGRGDKDNFIRFGRGDKDNFMRFGRKDKDNFIRFGRGDKDNFIRFGRKDNFMRFGRGDKDNFMRFGRKDKDNFMRFGRADIDNFSRENVLDGSEHAVDINGFDDQFFRAVRNDNFMRFGKAIKSNNFLRFGKSDGKNDNFIRFGRSSKQNGTNLSPLDGNSLEVENDTKGNQVVRRKRTLKAKTAEKVPKTFQLPGNLLSTSFILIDRGHNVEGSETQKMTVSSVDRKRKQNESIRFG